MNSERFSRLVLALFLVFGLLLAVACAPAAGSGSEPGAEEIEEEMGHDLEQDEGEDHEHDGDHEDGDHGHSDEQADGRVANEGAAVRIVSPADGATFQAGEQIIIQIETENFDLGQDDNHWHVYVDGSSWGMIMGANTDEALSGIEPGEHEISVYLSIGTHEELEEGDSITVTVEE